MRVKDLRLFHVLIPLRKNVSHHLASYCQSESLIIRMETEEGIVGWGESHPRHYLTGETFASVKRTSGELFEQHLARKTFSSFGDVWSHLSDLDIPRDKLAAFCGLELGILDVAGKYFGVYVGDAIGPPLGLAAEVAANIGFDTPTEHIFKICMLIKMRGYRSTKIKVGREDDTERVALVREALDDMFLWVDANGAWNFDQARKNILALMRNGIEVYEQPLAATDSVGAKDLRCVTGAKLVADESLCSMEDADHLVDVHACDIFNIRVGKCGGILRSLALVNKAHKHGLGFHLGALVGETGVLLKPLHMLVERMQGYKAVEGTEQNRNLLADDIVRGKSSFGLGIDVDKSKIEMYTIDTAPAYRAETFNIEFNLGGTEMNNQIQENVINFITTISGGNNYDLACDVSLTGVGIVDSLSMIELISWLEETYQMTIPPDDFVPENFDTVNAICEYVQSRRVDSNG